MPYVAAVFDRTQTDIDTRTSKAFFNVATWDRIEDNSIFVKDELITFAGVVIVFTGTTSAPAITSIPDVDDFNRLLENIEQLRQAALVAIPNLALESGYSAISHDWAAGVAQDAPDYADVNRWEKVIDLIHSKIGTYTSLRFRYPRTGVAMANSGLTWNNRFRA